MIRTHTFPKINSLHLYARFTFVAATSLSVAGPQLSCRKVNMWFFFAHWMCSPSCIPYLS